MAGRTRHHVRITVAALLAILDRVTTRGGELTQEEHTLFTACEIWAAAGMRALPKLLGRQPADGLRSASTVFVAIGATQSAEALLRAADVAEISTPRQRYRLLQDLGERLRCNLEPVDALIARFASSLVPESVLREHSGSIRPAPRRAPIARALTLH